jgi:primary-amine oxidase
VSLSIREYVATKTEVKAIRFIACYLLPPPKKVVLAYLDIPLTPEGKAEIPSQIVRRAEIDVGG